MESDRKRTCIAQRAARQTQQLFSLLGEPTDVLTTNDERSTFRQGSRTTVGDEPVVSFNPPEARAAATLNNDSLQSDLTAGAASHPISSAAADVGYSFQPSPDIAVCTEGSAASSDETHVGDEDLGRALQKWAVKHGIKRDALSDLLKLLKPHHSFLPSDARTLLRTPRGQCLDCPITDLAPGHYCHFGLQRGLLRALSGFRQLPQTLALAFNIDGLPLAKSSNLQLWPIQCLIINSKKQVPFLVGAFAGPSKPESANDFLLPFVTELKGVLEHGISVNGQSVPVCVKAFICDAPARSFILSTKGHSGYSACPKCTCEGTYRGNRVVLLDSDCEMRTNASFRQQKDPDHHKGTSILVDLPIDLVRDVPLDYMHLVLLGVVKKLLLLWLSGPLSSRVGPFERRCMNEASDDLRCHIPQEFSRSTRPVTEVERWKAAEFRLFLFYTGPVILKSVLRPALYDNFLFLHSALSILANRELCRQHTEYARALLRHFVESFKKMYGEEQVSYNVHCLIHLADDVEVHGAVDDFSAFPFENNMRHVKKDLRKHERPLQQLRNRMLERSQLPVVTDDAVDFELAEPQNTGSLPPECLGPGFGTARAHFVLPDGCLTGAIWLVSTSYTTCTSQVTSSSHIACIDCSSRTCFSSRTAASPGPSVISEPSGLSRPATVPAPVVSLQPAASPALTVLPEREFQCQVLRTLNIIKLTVQQIASTMDSSLASTRTASTPAPLVSGPFEEVDDLMKFEASLTQENAEVLINELMQLGGRNPNVAVKRMLIYLMSDKVATQFSWHGKKGKRKFLDLKLCQYLFTAIRKRFRHSTRDDVESSVKSWLRHAPERANGNGKANSEV
ncbi:hypothetical protein MTO96_038010 [Rhipicephalus appendiculatus]